MRPDELTAALRQLPDDLRMRAEPLLPHATSKRCEQCERIGDALRMAFTAAHYDDLSAAANLIATAERFAAAHVRLSSLACHLRRSEHQRGRGQVARWAQAPGPLIAATDASWKGRTGGIAYVVSDGRYGLRSWILGRQDPTGPSRVLINELRAVEFLLSAYAEPPAGLTVLVDSTVALRYLLRWQHGDTASMPTGYSLRQRRWSDQPTLVRLAGLVAERPDLRFEHVKGHGGHLLNEAADALCSMARRHKLQPFDIEPRARDLVVSFVSSWRSLNVGHQRP